MRLTIAFSITALLLAALFVSMTSSSVTEKSARDRQAVATIIATNNKIEMEVEKQKTRMKKEKVTREYEEWSYRITRPIYTILESSVVIMMIVSTICVTLIAIDFYLKRRNPIVKVSGLPIQRKQLGDHEWVVNLIRDEMLRTVLISETRSTKPFSSLTNLTYSPSLTNSNREKEVTGSGQVVAGPTRVPTISQLLRSGALSGEIVFGFDCEQERYCIQASNMRSCLVLGNSGAGKTNTISSLCYQLSVLGFDLHVSDPHMGHEESLSSRLAYIGLSSKQSSDGGVLSQSVMMRAALKKAKDTGESNAMCWVLDELNAIMSMDCASHIQATLEAIAQEGRKYKLVAIASSPSTRSEKFGGSSLRDSFPVLVLHRLRRSALRNVGLVSSGKFSKVENLGRGMFMLDDGEREPIILTCPYVDVDQEANRKTKQLTIDTQSYARSRKDEPKHEASNHKEAKAQMMEAYDNLSDEEKKMASALVLGKKKDALTETERKVIDGIMSGKTVPDIIKDVYGFKGGRKSQQAHQEIATILRVFISQNSDV